MAEKNNDGPTVIKPSLADAGPLPAGPPAMTPSVKDTAQESQSSTENKQTLNQSTIEPLEIADEFSRSKLRLYTIFIALCVDLPHREPLTYHVSNPNPVRAIHRRPRPNNRIDSNPLHHL